MNINELFEEIQDEFLPEQLNGEFLLQGNCVVWSYDLNENAEEIDDFDEDEDDFSFDFEACSSEELLLEASQEDMEKINELFDELEETDNWTISDTDTTGNTITFKIS